jgi:phosphatidylglycerophosphatase A
MTILANPGYRFMLSHPAHVIALGFGSGLAPTAPGTFGTLFGWVSFNLLAPMLTWQGWLALLVGGFLLGVWACERTGRDLGVADHGGMVWDEIIAIWLVLFFLPTTLVWQAVGFLLFRLFDIFKPAPIAQFERAFKNGFGVMGDDLIAAFFTLLVLALGVRIL